MSDDAFETVVIAYSQPQAGVIMSLFAWNGIPAYAANLETVRAVCPWTLALGAIPIRVHPGFAEEARAILTEAAEQPYEPLSEPLSDRIWRTAFFGVVGGTPPPRLSAEIVG